MLFRSQIFYARENWRSREIYSISNCAKNVHVHLNWNFVYAYVAEYGDSLKEPNVKILLIPVE